MQKLTETKIREIIQGNAESLNIEFKSSFNFNTNAWMREKLIRSILAMSNTRNGGFIVIGVGEKSDKFPDFVGIKKSDFSTFNTDIVKEKVESFSNFPVVYEIGYGPYKKADYIIISVAEFTINPVICKKNGDNQKGKPVLEEGAIYIRTQKDKPSSVKISNPIDVQDIIERITDKQITNLHKRGWKHETESLTNKSDKNLFEKERDKF